MKTVFWVLTVLVLLSFRLSAQQKVVIISDKVGENVDSVESKIYFLFNGYKNFRNAVFYRSTDGKFFVKIYYSNNGIQENDTSIFIDKSTLVRLVFNIEYFDEIPKGLDVTNQKYLIDTTGAVIKIKMSGIYKDELPHIKTKYKPYEEDPLTGLGVSVAYLSMDLTNVKLFFDAAEQKFRDQGWQIPKNNLNMDVSKMYQFNFFIRIYRTIGLDFVIGKNFSSDVKLSYYGGFLRYHLNLKKPAWLKPFISAGAGNYSFSVENSYGSIVDPSGAYLDKIISSGGKTGLMLNAGCEIGPESYNRYLPFCMNVFAQYSFFPSVSNNNYGYNTIVNFGGFSLGAGIRFYY